MQKISLVYFRYSLLASLVCDFFSLAKSPDLARLLEALLTGISDHTWK